MSPTILVTGASGFVGRHLCAELMHRGCSVRGAVRCITGMMLPCPVVQISDISPATDWSCALDGIDTVIHLAARVHVMHDDASDPLAEFRRTNTAGTEHLARSAAASGVRRFVYVSSVKVNGEETAGDHRYSEQDAPSPQDPYGVSKWEAEQALKRVAQDTGLHVVIVRIPLVYGAGVKGNFVQMMRIVARELPLPLGSVQNLRDLIYVGNLVDALILLAEHPTAIGQTYLLCDGKPVSTSALLHSVAKALGVRPRLFPLPQRILQLAGKMSGKSAQVERLIGSLQIDGSKIQQELKWHPPYTMQQGLQATAEWYWAQKPD